MTFWRRDASLIRLHDLFRIVSRQYSNNFSILGLQYIDTVLQNQSFILVTELMETIDLCFKKLYEEKVPAFWLFDTIDVSDTIDVNDTIDFIIQ